MPSIYTQTASGDRFRVIPDRWTVDYVYVPSSVDAWIYEATDDVEIIDVRHIVGVTAGAAVTATLRKNASGAPTSGNSVTTTALALDATANTTVVKTLTATTADRQLASGQRISLDFSAALGVGATGLIQVELKRRFPLVDF